MPEQTRLTMDNVQALYPPDKFILVLPSVSKHLLGPSMYGIDVATVKVDPDTPKMTYATKSTWDKRTSPWTEIITDVGLSAVALNKIAGAADINVVPDLVLDDPDRMLIIYRATAMMKTPGGDIRGRSAQVRWDGRVVQDSLQLNAEQSVDKGIAKRWDGFTEETRERKISEKFRKDWIQERTYGDRKTQSYACRNAIKLLLGMSDEYPIGELRDKEFAVVKFVFAPDLTDPQIRLLVAQHGLQGQRALWGDGPAQVGRPALLADLSEAPAPTEAMRIQADFQRAPGAPVSDAETPTSQGSADAELTTDTPAQAAALAKEQDGPLLSWMDVQPIADACARILTAARAAGVDASKTDPFAIRLADATAEQDQALLRSLYIDLKEKTL